jgi:hypothetical protein
MKMEFETSEGKFVATCTELSDGTWKARLESRSPAGFASQPSFPEEDFTGKTLLDVIEACRQRVSELCGEILDEIPRDES